MNTALGFVGMSREEIETPALLIDLDILDKNIKTLADYYRGKKGAIFRPHQKGHRFPAIARKQLKAGAYGVCVTSLGLAELYAHSGIDNILITSEVYGRNKIARLCGLSKSADITVGVDNIENVRQISKAALDFHTKVNIAVELYLGSTSCGVELEKVKSFVKELDGFNGINFRGLWWHDANGMYPNFEERKKAHFQVLDGVASVKADIEDAGYEVEIVSGGHTLTWNITPEYSRLTNVEVQVGNYVFSDWCSSFYEGLEAFDCALTVLTRCISRPIPSEAMFDLGLNSCSNEHTNDYRKVVGPRFKDIEGLEDITLREELAYASCRNASRAIRPGDVFELIPPHADTTAKLHDKYYGVRDGIVEVIWPNYGRGLF